MLSTYHFAKLHLFHRHTNYFCFAAKWRGNILGENVLTAILGGKGLGRATVKKEGRLTNINAIRDK